MEYSKVLDLATDLGYNLSMNGAETFRIEESITRVLAAYEIEAEVFVIPNCMHISIEPIVGRPQTRMRRIGIHGNDLDAVEQYSNLSRRICLERPDPEIAAQWLRETGTKIRRYSMPIHLLGCSIGALGFSLLFGAGFVDCLLAGVCGLVAGAFAKWMERLGTNQFFSTIIAAFPMALLAYLMNMLYPGVRSDCVIIGALMNLVPGLLITNAMRDIIYGDTNAGINRIVQVLLIALAIALGVGAALGAVSSLIHAPVSPEPLANSIPVQCIGCILGCLGFAIVFNVHGPGGVLCVLGGMIVWLIYALSVRHGIGELQSYFMAAIFAGIFAEVMARIRKYPTTAYLVISIFPLIPGAGMYYTMQYAVQGDMNRFAHQGLFTAAIAGTMALGILLIATVFRVWSVRKFQKNAPR